MAIFFKKLEMYNKMASKIYKISLLTSMQFWTILKIRMQNLFLQNIVIFVLYNDLVPDDMTKFKNF